MTALPRQPAVPEQAKARDPANSRYTQKRHLVLRAGGDPGKRVGIYAMGGCDVPSIFATAPLIQEVLDGTCGIVHDGWIHDARSDLILQSLQAVPEELVQPITERLDLAPDSFKPRLFESSFAVSEANGIEIFPKTVVIASIGADVMRIIYRHREYGLLVDPGGIWLGKPMGEVLEDDSTPRWFRDHFVSIGRISLDDFMINFSQIVQLVRQKTGAHVLVFNTLNPEPRNMLHNYQFVKDPAVLRRREFNLGLIELSRQLDFPIVDIDRLMQRTGIQSQLDWAHPHPRQFLAVGQEIFRILRDLAVF
jgi:hypothetical protein